MMCESFLVNCWIYSDMMYDSLFLVNCWFIPEILLFIPDKLHIMISGVSDWIGS